MSMVLFGKGFVGKATALILGDEPAWHDPAKGHVLDDFGSFRYAVICVPTPGVDGGLDHSAIEDCKSLLLDKGFCGTMVVRSTCQPWYLTRLAAEYGSVVYWPEFLRERHAEEDSLNPRQVIVGGPLAVATDWCRRIKRSGYGIGVEWTVTDLQTAAVIKLGLNSALAAKVMMFNALRDACTATGADWETVRHAVGNDPRIGSEHTMVPGPDGKRGFGGKCLPKDLGSFRELVPDDAFVAGILSRNREVRDD